MFATPVGEHSGPAVSSFSFLPPCPLAGLGLLAAGCLVLGGGGGLAGSLAGGLAAPGCALALWLSSQARRGFGPPWRTAAAGRQRNSQRGAVRSRPCALHLSRSFHERHCQRWSHLRDHRRCCCLMGCPF